MQGTLRLKDANETECSHRSAERTLGHFQQGGRIRFSVIAECHHDAFVYCLLTHVTDPGICEPNEWMPPIADLKQRLEAVEPDVMPLHVEQFVQENRAQLITR